MKLRDIIKQINFIADCKEPVLFIDSDTPGFIKKFRHTKNGTLGFYDTFNHEIDRHIDQLLDLEVVFIQDKSNMIELYIKGFKDIVERF